MPKPTPKTFFFPAVKLLCFCWQSMGEEEQRHENDDEEEEMVGLKERVWIDVVSVKVEIAIVGFVRAFFLLFFPYLWELQAFGLESSESTTDKKNNSVDMIVGPTCHVIN